MHCAWKAVAWHCRLALLWRAWVFACTERLPLLLTCLPACRPAAECGALHHADELSAEGGAGARYTAATCSLAAGLGAAERHQQAGRLIGRQSNTLPCPAFYFCRHYCWLIVLCAVGAVDPGVS